MSYENLNKKYDNYTAPIDCDYFIRYKEDFMMNLREWLKNMKIWFASAKVMMEIK